MTYKITSISALIISVVVSAIADDYQILTDQSGREIEAKIIRMLPGGQKITVQRKGQRKQLTVPITAFDDATRERISDWFKHSDFLNSGSLVIELDRVRRKAADKSSSSESTFDDIHGNSFTSFSEVRYYNHLVEINLNNKSDQAFENVQLEYVLFYMQEATSQKRNKDGRKTNIYNKNQEKHGTLYHKEEIKIPSKTKFPIETKGIILLQKNFGSSSTIPPIDGEFEGAIIRMTLPTDSGNPLVRELRYPEKLKRNWTTETNNTQPPAP
ncbi:hypothetical protein P4B35_14995 [Pontiellaceae bacterium B12227]|nr:hypothetical protein [Pontiellaceae bacterium B12227]